MNFPTFLPSFSVIWRCPSGGCRDRRAGFLPGNRPDRMAGTKKVQQCVIYRCYLLCSQCTTAGYVVSSVGRELVRARAEPRLVRTASEPRLGLESL